mmetsp:Transcript_38991/g.121449  ORF Transcript_38991/g.121449 Transcript_38991/m.121449 type:complete len:218 (-) Transcript_38991:16-669(-)
MEGMAAGCDLDDVIRLPSPEADGALGGVKLALLVPEHCLIIGVRLQLVDRVRRSAMPRLPLSCHVRDHSVSQELVVPVREDEAENANKVTVYCVQLQGLVKLGVVLLADRRLHEMEPEEHRAHDEDVQGAITQKQVYAVGVTKSVGARVDPDDPRRHAGQEEGQPGEEEPSEVNEENLGVVPELIVVVLAVSVVLLDGGHHHEQVVADPQHGDHGDN